MQVLTYLVVGIIVTFFYVLVFKERNKKEIIKTVGKYVIGINLVSLFIIRWLLDKRNVVSIETYKYPFIPKYILFSVGIGGIFLILKALINRKIVFEKSFNRMMKAESLTSMLSIVLFSIGSFFFIGTRWFIQFFGKLTPEQFIFNFNSPIKGTSSNVQNQIVNGPLLSLLAIIILFIFITYSKFNFFYNDHQVLSDKLIKPSIVILSIIIFFSGIVYSVKELSLVAVYHSYFDDSSYIKDNYLDPKMANLTFPSKKRNVIHIYLESYENSYFDKNSGGYMEQNLMPEYEKFYDEGISFSDNQRKGGAFQTYGSSWSVASMVNMSMGLPLKIPMNGNSYGKSGYFLPGATAIGNLLNKEGYNQTVMFGADADFGGLTTFFNSHGKFEIYDVKYAREKGKIPKDYNVWWGFEDKKLYTFAKEEILRLASENQPFNFTMENADTHFPDGYIEKGTPKPFEQQYANVIFHSQKQVAEFIKWIQAQSFYKDTVIVLTGDHLSMDKHFFANFDKKYHRTTTNLIINGTFKNEKIRTTNRQFAPFDMFPTILSSMGVDIDGSRLGLGTDLSSNQKTLIERDSLEKVNDELAKNSNFYTKEFISEK